MKSTFRTLFYLKKNQPKSNGLVPIIVRVTVNTQVVQFGCKLDINPEIWDVKAGKAIGRSKEASDVNTALDNLKVAIRKSYDKQMEDYGYAMPEKIRNQVLGLEKGAKPLVEYIDLHNQQYENRVGINTTRTTFIRYKLVKERV